VDLRSWTFRVSTRAQSFRTRRRAFLPALIALSLAAAAGTIESSSSLGAQRSKSPGLAAFSSKLRAQARLCSRTPSKRRYVSTRGSDSNSGRLQHPWKTLSRAFDAAVAGEAVYLRSGTYPGWAIEGRSGTADAPISLRAFPRERPVITGRLKVGGDYFCVSGLRFRGRTPANKSSVLIYVSGAHHVEILNNAIQDSFLSGIYVGDEGDLSSDVSIIGNYIRGNGTHDRFDHGVYFGHVNRGLIANNLVVRNLAVGLKIAPEANDVIVTQNTIVANGLAGVIVGGELSWSSNRDLVVNNVVADNAGWGIRSYWEQTVGSGNLALRNLVFANKTGAFWFPRGGMLQRRSILADPRFVSAADYRLRHSSPGINRAILAYSMPFDFDGRVRSSRGRPDLGAFER
jgi:hypothetical protein